MAAFAARGRQAELLDPAAFRLSLHGEPADLPRVAVDRGVATLERAALAAILAASGSVVVNRVATTRLLVDRLALLRHLIVAGIPVPETTVAFGERAALNALDTAGYPAWLRSLQVDPRVSDAFITDGDSAEAVIEHRVTLGHERAVLVQRHVEGTRLLLAVIGSELVGVERVQHDDGEQPMIAGGAELCRLRSLAEQVISRLGIGVYAIEVVAADHGPVVVGASSLVDFRSFSEAGVDIAGLIADFTVDQLERSEGSRA